MSSLPPEHSEYPARQATSEPRLLTRRNTDATDADTTRETPESSGAIARPARHSFHPLQSLDRLRGRLRRQPAPNDDLSTEPWPPKPRRRSTAVRVLRYLTLAVLWLVILGCLALLTFSLYLRSDMRAALPQLDGDLHVAGLAAPVTVSRDQQGVPTIQAATTEDLLFAQGFVAAQDRLWQMDALRRHAAGELAEIMGSSLIEHDRQQRYLQLRAAADRAIAVLPPDQLSQLQAYARGVNAFLESNADHLPVEFHLLHYKPASWVPRDSLLVGLAMFQDLGTSYPVKLHREAFSQHLPPELLADLYPTKSFRDQPPTATPRDLTAIQPEVLQIPLDDSQVKLHIPAIAFPSQNPEPRCPECISGSNNWAVSGKHTASGKPMVSNDMHLGLSVPGVWYEATLRTSGSAGEPAFDATGFSLPGTPFLIVGRNAHVAWSFTNLGADVQDLHIEHLRGSADSTEFQQTDGSWAAVNHHLEVIRVRGGHDQTLDVLTTYTHIGGSETQAVETPIISPLFPQDPEARRALSLLWTPYVPQNLSSPFYAVNTAASGSALVASLASFGGPSLNLVYADDSGHIGYHAIGRIPIRGAADHHLRAPEQQLPPENDNPLPDETPEGEPAPGGGTPEAQPAAWLQRSPAFAASQLLEAGFIVRRGRRIRAPRREEPAPGTRGRRIPLKPEPVKILPEAPIAPVPSVRDYTIGLPIPNVPVDALDPAAHWSGYIPFEELPAVTDPTDGILATANARVTPDDYPYFITDNWAPPYRTERIRRLLTNRTRLIPADMLAIETDTTSAFDLLLAQRLAYAVDHASDKVLSKDRKRLHQAADLLRSWQGNMALDAANSPAAAIVAAARPAVLSALLAPQIARHDKLSPTSSSLQRIAASYQWTGETVALENILTFQPDRWLPTTFGNWNDFLASALARGLSDHSAPHDLSRWSYGSMHTVDIEHPVFGLSPLLSRLIGARTGTSAQPVAGDGTTIQATGHAFGPSERFTADLADGAATTGNIPTGQSGNPASPYFLSQFPAWLHGSTFALPLGGSPAQHTLRLLP